MPRTGTDPHRHDPTAVPAALPRKRIVNDFTRRWFPQKRAPLFCGQRMRVLSCRIARIRSAVLYQLVPGYP